MCGIHKVLARVELQHPVLTHHQLHHWHTRHLIALASADLEHGFKRREFTSLVANVLEEVLVEVRGELRLKGHSWHDHVEEGRVGLLCFAVQLVGVSFVVVNSEAIFKLGVPNDVTKRKSEEKWLNAYRSSGVNRQLSHI